MRFDPGNTLRYEFQTTGIASGEDYAVLLESGEAPPLQSDNLTKYTHLHMVGTCVDVANGRHANDIRVPLAEGTSYPSLKIIRETLVDQGVFPPPGKGKG